MKAQANYSAIVADDHELLRHGIANILEEQGNIRVVAHASDGLSAVALTKRHQPDLLTLDIAMPFAQGISVLVEVKRWSPDTRVAVFSGITSSALLRELQDAGADGIFTKRGAISEFEQAIPILLEGGKIVSSDAAEIIAKGTETAALTKRERQIISKIASGLTTKAIAKRLGISPKTVENHRSSIMSKLGVQSMAELLAYAVREGLFDVQSQL
ncbi:two component transcriptional regulator, LuxR family [Cognatiyoonia koreensis]|uniref:Two component transcriptional regulator, LuxR family n=1 Tax=Cognatiyoonia koreensis TaxID=364200 RepID=A0A1I0RHY1_9RHOB|nr:response regulator transcription factor [Cognatiyoonia koreensis]SEW40539.1 two component transcriptional regulator, LuxR family [Cognatiyoonia koreensis]